MKLWKSAFGLIIISFVLSPFCLSAQTENPATTESHEQIAPSGPSNKQIFTLEPISVIATKTPKTPLESPGSVSVITADEIDAFTAEHPFKVLNLTEGIWPRQYRGLADFWARPVIRGQRALVLVDGLSWYDYGHYVDTGAIPMPDVERIDVVRGPFSALYGTLAQTAVINYITKVPEETQIEASASYGDWNSRFYSVRFADRPFKTNENDTPNLSWFNSVLGDRFFYSASFKSRTTDGYVTTPSYKTLSPVSGELDPSIPVVTGWEKDIDPQTGQERYKIGHQGDNWYKDYGLFIKTGYDFSPDSRLWYSVNYSEFEYGWSDGSSYLRDSSGHALYEGDVYIQDGGQTYATSLNSFLFTSDPKTKESFVHTLSFNHSVPGAFDLAALIGFYDKKSATHYAGSARYKVEDDDLTQADLAATFHFFENRFLLTMGVQGVREQVTVTDSNLADAYDKDAEISVRERTNGTNLTLGTFLQAEYSPIESFSAYMGGRYDHWWGVDADYYSSLSGAYYTEHPDVDDGHFSPKASIVYRPLENGSIRASYGESFTAPSLYYRTSSYYWEGGGSISKTNPNPDLGPVTNKAWEIGTEWELWERRIRVKATYFENNFEDMIVNESKTTILEDGTQLIEKQRANADEADVDGLELAVEALLPFNLKGGLFYTHNWSEYTKTQSSSKEGWEVDETPTDLWSAWIGYFGERLDVTLSYRYCDARYDDEYAQYGENLYKGDDEYHIVDAKITVRPIKHVDVSLSVDNLFDEEYYEYYKGPGRFILGTVSFSY